MDASKILTRDEIATVLRDLKRRAKRNPNSRVNLILFRLACCCGLRRKEICGINLGDVIVGGSRPCVRIRKEVTKGRDGKRKARLVPLWWDEGTLIDLRRWLEFRAGESPDAPLVCSYYGRQLGQRLTESLVAKRWRTAIKALGPERRKQLSIHCGRHSFCSHALFIGRSLAEVRDAAGHANIHTTSIYLHYLERTGVPDLFEFLDE